MNVCVIPARGGSKRIPHKNIVDFHGRPMIAWSIVAARDAGVFSRIVVSTDDDDIAAVSRKEGAEVPFFRPSALAGDYIPTIPVIAHAVRSLGLASETPVCCLYATAPMVQPADIKKGLELLEQGVQFVLSITTFPYPIQRALRLRPDGWVEMIDAAQVGARSQDLEETWHDAGQFYWARADTWCTDSTALKLGPGTIGLPLPRYRVQDIDTPEDLITAKALFSVVKAGL